jgi:uncharacterized alkaline shock family protein YloU
VISHDVLASYAADAARDVAGLRVLVEGPRRHRGVRVTEDDDGSVAVEVHIELDWGAVAPDVGDAVQRRVAEYLRRTAKPSSLVVDVVIARVAAATS